MARRREGIVRPFESEPDLLAHLPEAEAKVARHQTVVDYMTVAKGQLTPPAFEVESFDLGFLVLDGLLLRRVEFVGRRAVEVLGPGDMIRPWRPEQDSPSIPSRAGWKVCEQTQL